MKNSTFSYFTTILSVVFLSISSPLFSQTTYTWNVASGSFLTPASWTPTRTTPQTNDILLFNGSVQANPQVTNIRSQSVGRLRLINNANVTFVNAIPDTLIGTISRSGTSVTGSGTTFTTQLRTGDQIFSLSPYTWLGEINVISSSTTLTMGSAGTLTSISCLIFPRLICEAASTSLPSFEILNGSTLNMPCDSPGLIILADTGSFANIFGLISLGGRGRLYGSDTSSFRVKNLGEIRASSTFLGNVFGLVGNSNIVTFDSGSVYHHIAGASPFGLTAPYSKVTYYPGSTYLFESTSGTPSFSGRTYPNFIYRSPNSYSITGSSNTSVDNIEIDSGSFTIAMTGILNIKGNIYVNTPGSLFMNTASGTPNYIFKGSKLQSINGSGSLSINSTTNSICNITLSNIYGLQLNRSVGFGRGLFVLDTGALNLNGNTLTIGNDSINYGAMTVNTGYLTGTGIFKRWFTNALSYSFGNDTSRFPFGISATVRRDLWINGTPSVCGTISVSHNNIAGNTAFSTPFSDNATNAVTVNIRQNSNWVMSTANGLAGTGFGLRIQGTATSTQVTNTTNLRLTLASGISPGTANDGGGTNTTPQANRTALTATNLNNTFYIGGNSSQNPLPVKLVSFNASNLNENNVLLEWKTSSEINVDRFEIEKSLDGVLFEKVATINASINSSSTTDYKNVDLNAFKNSNIIYYRLKIIDMNGLYENSKIVSVKKDLINTFSITNASPNPTSDNININISSIRNQNAKIEVIDMNGNIIYLSEKILSEGENIFNLNMNVVRNGIYFARITSSSDSKYFKILKN